MALWGPCCLDRTLWLGRVGPTSVRLKVAEVDSREFPSLGNDTVEELGSHRTGTLEP